MDNLISRQQAIEALWKALYEYEDKTEKQFQKSKDLDVRDWIMNDRLWVQNGHNLCVNVLANLPSVQPEYEPVTIEDFAKTMSENTLYGFMAWHGEAFTLIKEMGFEICKKTM